MKGLLQIHTIFEQVYHRDKSLCRFIIASANTKAVSRTVHPETVFHFPQIGAGAWRLPPLVGLLEEIAVIQAQNLDSLLTGLEIKIDSLERARQSLLESGRLAQSTHLALHLLKRCPPGLQPLPWAELKRKRDGVISIQWVKFFIKSDTSGVVIFKKVDAL